METFDLIIIGGGAAGFAAATKASELGVKTALINSGLPIGGTCVNVGCVPSKVLLEIGSEYYYPKTPRFRAVKNGHSTSFNFTDAIQEKDEMVKALRRQNYIQVAEGLTGLTVMEGRAKFVSTHEIEISGRKLQGEKFIIATGSRPKVPPFKGIDKVHYVTSREALSLPALPRSMVIIGGGPVGLEFAQMFAHFGTRVTLLKRGTQVLSQAEPEIASELQSCLQEEGIEIHTGVNILHLTEHMDVKQVEAAIKGENRVFKAGELLLATGVAPNSDELGLEIIGVKLSKTGFIQVNSELQTSSPHIWAAGDVVGNGFLETVAAKEGYIAASNALGNAGKTIDYDSIPKAVFTEPQVAWVGITEEEEMRRLNTCSCRTLQIALVPKAQAVKETRGLIKMIIHPESKVIMGVHIVAPLAADLIHEAALAVKFKHTIDDIIDTTHVFPTMSEAIKRVAQSFKRDISRMSCCVE